ncbi:MAG: hypothetical protein NZ954_01095 [Thermofilaceae archaeon]|nr:hypothetical protein [Thermofilaceae archaeon]MCX8180534.1 hypothetical protein [Thermofilaceae archaeon]MDW8003270.1 RpoL/Rpb11 RNA polymerase subunit family protein [Thermofilaceae archaeon]
MSDKLELIVVRDEINKLTLRIKGEDHTLLNLLVEELNKDANVTFAAYRLEHPLTGEYTLTIFTDGNKKPVDALMEAVERVKGTFQELLRQWRNIKER